MWSRREWLIASASAMAGFMGCENKRTETPPTRVRVDSADRSVTRIIPATMTRDGAGVRLRRSIGHSQLSDLDPFLLLDEFHSNEPDDYVRGFPWHPHRGFETVTYVIDGAVEHQDTLGNHGHLGPGTVQWMTAGHGIIHSEMPRGHDNLLWGFQLWVNLPARLKHTRPRYQDMPASQIPEVSLGDGRARVVAGKFRNVEGPVTGIAVDPLFLDIAMPGGGALRESMPAEHRAFAYVIAGSIRLGQRMQPVTTGELAILSPGTSIACASDGPARFLLAAARSIGEPIARGGPFVMNTPEEIRQAWQDYQDGHLLEG
jgi:redox-sensitive bicupin YhaK (pirin superfamily)